MSDRVDKIWQEHDAKRDIITKVLEQAKKNQLSVEHKKILFEMINNSNRTEKQKDRFIKFYNLDISQKQNYTLTTLAKKYGCKSTAIRFSLLSVINYTLFNNEENMCILKKMIEA